MTTALVTGAGRGIGRGVALTLADAGFDVVMASLEEAPEPWPETAGRLHYERFDLADLDSHTGLIERSVARFGPLACLVNNAGVSTITRGDMLDLTRESFDRSIAVNLRGTFFLTQAVARHFLAVPEPSGGYRSIVTISSVNAEIVGENRSDYCITKSALTMLSKLFAARLAEAGIGVFEIRPGIIDTEMIAPARPRYEAYIRDGGVPMRRWGQPEDIGGVILTLASGGLPFTTGIHLDVGGGMHLHRL